MKILLATPTKDHTVYVPYLRSVVELVRHLGRTRPDIELQIETRSNLTIDTARNLFATWMLLEPSFTHLLFVDADMGFEPSLVERMLAFDRPVVGTLYPVRRRDDARWLDAARRGGSPEQAAAFASDFVGEGALAQELDPASGRRGVPARDGFLRVTQVGAGVMLVRRQVFETMRRALPELWAERAPAPLQVVRGTPNGLFQCFAPLRNADGLYCGEDVSFCLRWTGACGGEIWACADERVTHSGPATFAGRFTDKVGRPTPRPAPEAPLTVAGL